MFVAPIHHYFAKGESKALVEEAMEMLQQRLGLSGLAVKMGRMRKQIRGLAKIYGLGRPPVVASEWKEERVQLLETRSCRFWDLVTDTRILPKNTPKVFGHCTSERTLHIASHNQPVVHQ